MALGTILGATSAGASALGVDLSNFSFKKVFSDISGIFKRKGCSGSDKQQRQELEDLIREFFTTEDLRYFSNLAKSPVSPNAQSIAHFYAGGNDCFHRNVNPADQSFLDQLPQRLDQRIREARSGASEAGNNIAKAGGGMNSPFIVIMIIISVFYFLMQQGK